MITFNADDFHAALKGYLRFDEESQQQSDDRLTFARQMMGQPIDMLAEMDEHDLAAMFSGVIGLDPSGHTLGAAAEFQPFLDLLNGAGKSGAAILSIFKQSYRWAIKQKELRPYLFNNQKKGV